MVAAGELPCRLCAKRARRRRPLQRQQQQLGGFARLAASVGRRPPPLSGKSGRADGPLLVALTARVVWANTQRSACLDGTVFSGRGGCLAAWQLGSLAARPGAVR